MSSSSNDDDSSKREASNAADISSNYNASSPHRPPPHSSDPSMTFSLLPKKQPALPTAQQKQQKHNRNVTPHTASLMSLFARPASTPLTPLTPPDSELVAAEESAAYGSLICDDSAPSLPEEDEGEDEQESVASHSYDDSYNDNDDEHEESTTPKNSNNSYTAATTAAIHNYSGERAPLLPTPPLSLGRQKTEVCSNKTSSATSAAAANDYHSMISHNRDDTHLIDNLSNHHHNQQQQQQHYQQQSWPWGKEQSQHQQKHHQWGKQLSNIPSQDGQDDDQIDESKSLKRSLIHSTLSKAGLNTPHEIKSTLIGAFLFSLYQLVFIFAEASAISRPSHPPSASSILLSPMANMACFGSLVAIPILIVVLGGDYPALYPALDMFMAPFLAKMAMDIDEVLVLQQQQQQDQVFSHGDDTDVFLATFVALNAFGMAVCAVLCVLASHVKLANLALFHSSRIQCFVDSSPRLG